MKRYRVVNDDDGGVIFDVISSHPPEMLPHGTLHEVPVDTPAATHFIDGQFVNRVPVEMRLMVIREQRSKLLSSSDWTQMPDAPLTPEQKTAWATYRQHLRDFPATCDPENPVWPVMPT